jgi:hypothetical protein
VIVLYMLSVGLAWAFGKKRNVEIAAHRSPQVLLCLVAAEWLRYKVAGLRSRGPAPA